jgi:hypothetical protein
MESKHYSQKSFIIVSESASFVPKRCNAGLGTALLHKDPEHDKQDEGNINSEILLDVKQAMRELGKSLLASDGDASSMSSLEQKENH